MKFSRLVHHLSLPLVVLLLANCAAKKQPPAPVPVPGAVYVNPYPVGTYPYFTAAPAYPKTYKVWKNAPVLARTNPTNSHIRIDLAKQRGLLMNGKDVAMDYPICSGREGHETPPGEYTIIEMLVDKKSDITKDTVPEGGRFEGAPMHNWMRLTNDGVGHHIAPVRRYPASHSCIRGQAGPILIVYDKVKLGTKVSVE